MDRGSALADIADMRAALARLAGRSIDTLTHPELLTALDDIESLTRQLPSQTQRITSRLTAETTPNELGAKSWRDVLTTRLRISRSDARRRLGDTEHL
ncbi:MAG: hypothetical protein QOI25_3159, partial [Mycobacterium sp.]|nr:hypothetical protein [Mycobacterium sp.]